MHQLLKLKTFAHAETNIRTVANREQFSIWSKRVDSKAEKKPNRIY